MFSRGHDMKYCKRLNAEADILLSSPKPDIKNICKNVNNGSLFVMIFLGGGRGNIVIVHKNYIICVNM